MYNYNLTDVPVIDETIDERSYEQDIVSNEKEQQQKQQELTTLTSKDLNRQDAFASLTKYMHYRFNSVDSRLENIELMLSEFLQKTRGI